MIRGAKIVLLVLLALIPVTAIVWYSSAQGPDLSAGESRIDDGAEMYRAGKRLLGKESYQQGRAEQIALWRGVPYPKPGVRNQAIAEMTGKEEMLRAAPGLPDEALGTWTPIGPAPIPNGQTELRTDPVSGRVTSIAVHPTNPDIVYIGTAQGGVYRTLDGGAIWTPMMDSALSLAIGAVVISPSDPTTVFVGTGEAGFSADAFFGVGIYRITNADTDPVLTGPLNLGTGGNDVFLNRSISRIVVTPTDPNTMFVSTTRGSCGNGGCLLPSAASRGIYRTTNAMDAAPIFTKLNVSPANSGNLDVTDIVIEPDNPNNLVAWVVSVSAVADGGVYRSTNALDASPTFSQSYVGTVLGARGELALQKTDSAVTVVAATGDLGSVSGVQGKVIKSVDGGATFSQNLPAYDSFCSPQCFYDIAVTFDPTSANNLYVGGAANSLGASVFSFSITGGLAKVDSKVGLHVDTHAIAVAPSSPSTIYFGSDGGVWRSTDSGLNWVSRNTATLNSIQFQSIDTHPTDPFFTIGGTQDNGTQFLRPDNTWVRATGGDGGQAVIDQTATNTSAVFGYHTFFNSTGTQIGYRRLGPFNAAGQVQTGINRGCFGGTSNHGITCTDSVLFYAPLSRGPGTPPAAGQPATPNTIYLGSNKLYRSDNRGDMHTVVSQSFGTTRLSAIGISPEDDNVRIIGLTNGTVLATTTGAAVLTDVSNGQIPSRYVTRAVVDPNSSNTAYITLSSYGLPLGHHVWKTTNLSSAAPTWTAAGNGIPDVPVNAFEVDPANSQNLFAGTDIGVYRSTDGGTSWTPFSSGLPRVAVFDMSIQPTSRVLRIATHGRGIWEQSLIEVPAVNVSVSGRVTTPGGLGLRNATVSITNGLGVSRDVRTTSFGFYNLNEVLSGQTYSIAVVSKRFRFAIRSVAVNDSLSNFDFAGLE